MTEPTEKALRGSIAHWQRLATNKPIDGEEPFADDCPLCKMFYDGARFADEVCGKCPVAKRTGEQNCNGSPWSDASAKYESNLGENQMRQFLAAARKELNFLKSLLPKKGKL